MTLIFYIILWLNNECKKWGYPRNPEYSSKTRGEIQMQMQMQIQKHRALPKPLVF